MASIYSHDNRDTVSELDRTVGTISPLDYRTSAIGGTASPSFNFELSPSNSVAVDRRTSSTTVYNRTSSPVLRRGTASPRGEKIPGNLLKARSTSQILDNSPSTPSLRSVEGYFPPYPPSVAGDEDVQRGRLRRPQTIVEPPSGAVSDSQLPIFARRATMPAFADGYMGGYHNHPPPPPVPPSATAAPVIPLRSMGHSHQPNRSRESSDVGVHQSQPQSDSRRSLVASIREKPSDETPTFAQRVFQAGQHDLLYDLQTTSGLKDHKEGFLDLTMLQRMSIHVLQQKLVEQVKAIGDKGAWMEIGIRETLHEYSDAIRDLEFMESRAGRRKTKDPFLLSTMKPMDCKLLEEAGLAWRDPKLKFKTSATDKLEYTKRISPLRLKLHALLKAMLGGLALLAPFLLMVLLSGRLVRVVVTCCSVVLFALAATVGTELRADKIALATAAYAAALILFVANNPPTYYEGWR